MARLFGTDGVRGVANRDLTPDLVLALGRAAARVLATPGQTVVVGRDSRLSGPMLEGALVAGLCSAGVDVRLAGIVPTPAVSWLTRADAAAFGAVISASHNPVADNGIKFFSHEGLKLRGDLELQIENAMERPGDDLPTGRLVGSIHAYEDAGARYVAHLLETISGSLDGLKVVLDCAYGAAFDVAPRAFRDAGAEVVALHAEADGARINVDCGSTAPAKLARLVADNDADLGLAFDGDADRVIAVDEKGAVVNGDKIIAICALQLHEAGALKNNVVVSTVMGNLGFRRFLEERDIEVVLAPVGDKFVAEAMAEHGAVLGGEQSGHVIFSQHAPTGDGILAGLKLAEAVAASGAPLSQAASAFDDFPQVLINVPVGSPHQLERAHGLWREVAEVESDLGEDGRVLVRPSGTEPLVRVMVEARREDVARTAAERLASSVRDELG